MTQRIALEWVASLSKADRKIHSEAKKRWPATRMKSTSPRTKDNSVTVIDSGRYDPLPLCSCSFWITTRLLEEGADLVTVQQLLGHSPVTVTFFGFAMRYTHPNLDSKRSAVAKLESFGDNLVTPCTKMQQSKSKVSPIAPLNAVVRYN